MKAFRILLAIAAAGVTAVHAAAAVGAEGMTAAEMVHRLTNKEPPSSYGQQPTYSVDGVKDNWSGPWWHDNNPWRYGLDATQVCWYFRNLNATFYDITRASYECDIENTVFLANYRGPWKVSTLFSGVDILMV